MNLNIKKTVDKIVSYYFFIAKINENYVTKIISIKQEG